jgi:hypothetical protein
MKYGPIAESVWDRRLLESATAPRGYLDVLLPVLQSRVLMLGVRVGLFEHLGRAPASLESLSSQLSLDSTMLLLMLRILTGSGYVRYDGTAYSLTDIARNNFLPESHSHRTSHIALVELLWNAFGHMEAAVRGGKGLDVHEFLDGVAGWRTYQATMLVDARVHAPALAALIPVKTGAAKLLDIAGGHGLFGAALCRVHPPMRAEVLELPQALPHSRELALREGIAELVTHRGGDALVSDLGERLDVVLIFNLLHHLSAPRCRQLLARAIRAMTPGATLAIWEWRAPGATDTPDIVCDGTALFFRSMSAGQCYSTREYSTWLAECGFERIRAQRTLVAPQQVLITAYVP